MFNVLNKLILRFFKNIIVLIEIEIYHYQIFYVLKMLYLQYYARYIDRLALLVCILKIIKALRFKEKLSQVVLLT